MEAEVNQVPATESAQSELKDGDIVVADRFKHDENFPRIFKTDRVDHQSGRVYYEHCGIKDTIGTAYVRKATRWERLLFRLNLVR